MYMVKNGKGNELSRTAEIKKQIAACKKFSFERFRLTIYCMYTGTQEKEAPSTNKLLKKIEENGEVPERLSDAFAEKSRKYVKFTNLLTFNLRTFILFILLFLPWAGAEFFYIPFVVLILEPIRVAIILKYERLTKKLAGQDFSVSMKTE